MKFFEKLAGRKPKQATDYEALLASIDEEIADLEGRHALLKAALPGAAFEKSSEEVAAMRERVRALEGDIEFAKTTRDEAERRREAAASEEARAALVAQMEAAKADQRALKDAYIAYHEAASELVRQVKTIQDLRSKLVQWSHTVAAAGHGDMQVHDPFGLLRQQIAPHAYNVPGDHGTLTIVDYWPLPHPDGPPLGLMHKVKL